MMSTTTTTTNNNNNNVYNLENQRYTAAPLHQQLIIYWWSGRSLVDKFGVNELGHNSIVYHRMLICTSCCYCLPQDAIVSVEHMV